MSFLRPARDLTDEERVNMMERIGPFIGGMAKHLLHGATKPVSFFDYQAWYAVSQVEDEIRAHVSEDYWSHVIPARPRTLFDIISPNTLDAMLIVVYIVAITIIVQTAYRVLRWHPRWHRKPWLSFSVFVASIICSALPRYYDHYINLYEVLFEFTVITALFIFIHIVVIWTREYLKSTLVVLQTMCFGFFVWCTAILSGEVNRTTKAVRRGSQVMAEEYVMLSQPNEYAMHDGMRRTIRGRKPYSF